jgi:hypothetical protein
MTCPACDRDRAKRWPLDAGDAGKFAGQACHPCETLVMGRIPPKGGSAPIAFLYDDRPQHHSQDLYRGGDAAPSHHWGLPANTTQGCGLQWRTPGSQRRHRSSIDEADVAPGHQSCRPVSPQQTPLVGQIPCLAQSKRADADKNHIGYIRSSTHVSTSSDSSSPGARGKSHEMAVEGASRCRA